MADDGQKPQILRAVHPGNQDEWADGSGQGEGGEGEAGAGTEACEKVTTIYESNYRDIPATLRVIADEMESGEIQDAQACAIVMIGPNGVDIFGLGDNLDPATLFQIGIQYHINSLVSLYGSQDSE